jgi:hypothetical protein
MPATVGPLCDYALTASLISPTSGPWVDVISCHEPCHAAPDRHGFVAGRLPAAAGEGVVPVPVLCGGRDEERAPGEPEQVFVEPRAKRGRDGLVDSRGRVSVGCAE